ncbi:MAG: sigma-70 family RNA polymerase sigma factor [Magnetococcales bacterium]|nr:sigma-70 family RNA polymerase sigma factor [Magnetococcales bacterium]
MVATAKPSQDDATIREWVKRAQTREDNQAISQIIAALMPLVRHLARKYSPTFYDDLIQEGCLGILQSVQRFDLSQPTRFATFSHHYIRGKMLQYLATKAHVVRHPRGEKIQCESLDVPVFYEEDSIPIVELLQSNDPSPEEYLSKKEIQNRLYRAVSQLPANERTIILHHFWKSATLEELGTTLQTSRETVRRLGLEALKKIRQHLLKRKHSKGVIINAIVKRPESQKKNPVIIVSGPSAVDLKDFPIRHFILTTHQGKQHFSSQELLQLKQRSDPQATCLVRVSQEIAIRSIVKMVRILALYLGIPRKNITVELTAT